MRAAEPRSDARGALRGAARCVVVRAAGARASLEPRVLRSHRDGAERVRRAVEGVDLGRPRGRARAASAGRLLADAEACGRTSSTTCACSTARSTCPDGLAGKTFTVNGLRANADRRAAARRLPGRHVVEPTPDARCAGGRRSPSGRARSRSCARISCSASSTSCSASIICCSCSRCCCSCNGVGRLVATVTAFTVAHSITLGAATLGFVHVPSAPVEAIIALSILFLASELARRPAARAAPTTTANLTRRFPWVVAFAFGLLHGFGFAGALSEVGVPQHAVPLALLVLQRRRRARPALVHRRRVRLRVARAALGRARPAMWPRAVAYGIGSVAAFWVVERTIAVF